jgi:hypothetical protein
MKNLFNGSTQFDDLLAYIYLTINYSRVRPE